MGLRAYATWSNTRKREIGRSRNSKVADEVIILESRGALSQLEASHMPLL